MERGNSARLTKSEGREFGLVVGLAFVVLAALLWWRGHLALAWPAAGLGALLCLAGLIVPTRLGPLQKAWMGLAEAISRVTSPVLMGIVYLLVLTPIGLLLRLAGKKPLDRSSSGSYWIERQDCGASDLERQF